MPNNFENFNIFQQGSVLPRPAEANFDVPEAYDSFHTNDVQFVEGRSLGTEDPGELDDLASLGLSSHHHDHWRYDS